MDSATQTFVIVGASLTGAKAAATLRAEGFEGKIVLLGAEAERPYERPPLSKDYLRGEAEGSPHVHEEDYYASKRIDLRRSTRAVDLDAEEGVVTLEGGERVAYDRPQAARSRRRRRKSRFPTIRHLGPGAGLDRL